MPVGTKSSVTQMNGVGQDLENPSATNGFTGAVATQAPAAQAPQESASQVPEIKGISDEEFGTYVETGEEVDEATLIDNHTPVTSPIRATEASEAMFVDEMGGEEAYPESAFESVPGWDESLLTEAGEEAEPVIEAYYADAEAHESGEEFFGALAAVLAPVVKTVLPTIAGALVKQGATALSPRLQQLLARLSKLGINPAAMSGLLKGRETGNGYEAAVLDEAALEALEQQIEALEVVIGTDDRQRVQNTRLVPWKRICHLKIVTTTNKTYLGTGFFVGRRTIMTAGHCVYIHGQGGWAKQIIVTPGRNGSEEPYGKFTATSFRSVRGWVNGKMRDYDYAAIILPPSANISPDIGAFGFATYSDSFLKSKRLNTAGYPGDKPSGTMWFHGRHVTSLTPRTIVYDIDTAGGQSGSAVWIRDLQGNRIVVGIHTNGSPSGNSATRIVKPVLDNLKRWRLEGGN